MFKKILIALALVVLLFAAVGLMLSQHYTVARSVNVKADRAHIHPLVSDLKRWPEWSPWEAMDPTIKVTLGPITSGVGASQSWKGDTEGGRLTFTKSDNDGIAYDMVFTDGDRESLGKASMTYTQNGESTDVGWRMEGEMDVPVIGGYLALLSNQLIGPSFDKGLVQLKAKAEASRTSPLVAPASK